VASADFGFGISVAVRGLLTNKANLAAAESAARDASTATCRPAGGRWLPKTKPFGGRGRTDPPPVACCPVPVKFASFAARSGKCIGGQGHTAFESVAKRSQTFRVFPRLSETFRFVPARSASFRFVPARSASFRWVPGASQAWRGWHRPGGTVLLETRNEHGPDGAVAPAFPGKCIGGQGLTGFEGVAKRSASFRNLPKPSETFRNFPFRSVSFRSVPPRSGWFRTGARGGWRFAGRQDWEYLRELPRMDDDTPQACPSAGHGG
jgi:hypothetical protein